MMREAIGCLAVLLGAGCVLGFAGKPDDAKPQKLIKVTLECEKEFAVAPLLSIGADVVNPGGRAKNAKEGTKRMTFECLPGAMVSLTSKEAKSKIDAFLTVLPEDDGKTVQLRFEERAFYKNNTLCMIEFPDTQDAKDVAKQLDVLKRTKKGKDRGGLMVGLEFGAGSLPILQELKGLGAGLIMEKIPDTKSLPDEVFQKVARAVEKVEPRRVMIDSPGFDLLKGRLSKVESLFLIMDVRAGNAVPDLSKLANLRHLVLFVADDKGPGVIDVKPLAKLTQLKALTVFADGCKNAGAIGSLVNLQFLTMAWKSPSDLSILKRLPNLRHLAAQFPADADFSFVEKTPNLQTLSIMNMDETQNLKPLEKLRRLRCLAVSRENNAKVFRIEDFKNVMEFQKARPDVEVVECQGMCLGSFWLLPLAAAAAVAAWLIRRRWVGNRLACQR